MNPISKKGKVRMKNDREKIKNDFKIRIYRWILKLVKAIDQLPKDNSSHVMANQVIRSGTSVGANYIEAQCASSKKGFYQFFASFSEISKRIEILVGITKRYWKNE